MVWDPVPDPPFRLFAIQLVEFNKIWIDIILVPGRHERNKQFVVLIVHFGTWVGVGNSVQLKKDFLLWHKHFRQLWFIYKWYGNWIGSKNWSTAAISCQNGSDLLVLYFSKSIKNRCSSHPYGVGVSLKIIRINNRRGIYYEWYCYILDDGVQRNIEERKLIYRHFSKVAVKSPNYRTMRYN